MRQSIRLLTALLAGSLFLVLPGSPAATDESKDKQDVPELNLLNAMRDGQVAVRAEGIGDGRMTLSVTNRTGRPLRVVLPPGIVAQGAAGQFGGMGGGRGGGTTGGRGG